MKAMKTENLSILRRPICNILAAGVNAKSEKTRDIFFSMLVTANEKTINRVSQIVKNKYDWSLTHERTVEPSDVRDVIGDVLDLQTDVFTRINGAKTKP